MSISDYKKLINNRTKKNKYNNRRATVDGIDFDSIKEANYYSNLKLLKRSKSILDFERQVPIELIPSYIHKGKKIQAMKYYCDFKIYHNDGSIEYIDVKSAKSNLDPVYKLKIKLLHYLYRDIEIIEVY
jgi:hypothetical protein